MENFTKCYIEFNNVTLNDLLTDLRENFDNKQDNFAQICKSVYKIWSYCKNNYYETKNHEYYNSYKLLAKFGFDKKAVSRLTQCYVRFVYDYETDQNLPLNALPKVCIRYEFDNFSPSKLFELLSLSQDTVVEAVDKQLITPTMTVKEIREYIKTLKDGTDKAEKVIEDTTINEDEIPMAYDPKQEYEYSYFESKTKNQLLNIVWELQKAYQKLKSSKEKKQKND